MQKQKRQELQYLHSVDHILTNQTKKKIQNVIEGVVLKCNPHCRLKKAGGRHSEVECEGPGARPRLRGQTEQGLCWALPVLQDRTRGFRVLNEAAQLLCFPASLAN